MSFLLMAGCAVVDETGNPVVYYGANSAEDVPAPGEDMSPPSDALDAADAPFRPDTPSGDVGPDLGEVATPDVIILDVVDVAAPADASDAQMVDTVTPLDLPDVTEEVDAGMLVDVVALDIVDATAPADASDVPVDVVTPLDRPDILDVPPAVDAPPDTGVCPSGQTLCAGVCVDTRTNLSNCGTCGTMCPARSNATATCAAGACGIACTTGFANCDSNATNGCETDVRANVNNCGTCGTVCPARPNAAAACTAGVCGLTCATGFGNCDGNVTNGCETDTRTSALHCGTCGTACPSGVCEAGVCLIHPVIDVTFVDSRVTGLWVRLVTRAHPILIGAWAFMPCATNSPSRVCRIRLDRLTVPGGSTPVTAWNGVWGFETIPTRSSSMTTPLCSLDTRDCSTCGGGGEAFNCLGGVCFTTGAPPIEGPRRFQRLYDSIPPPGMVGGEAIHGFRVGFSTDGPLTCPTAP